MRAAAGLYHAYFTGLILTLVTRRSAGDAAEWVFRVFRHQHHEKFLSSFDKLGLKRHARCGRLRRLPLSLQQHRRRHGRVHARERPQGVGQLRAAALDLSRRQHLRGAERGVARLPARLVRENGVSLGNPRLGFVCTAQTTDGQHGLSGYFLEHDRELAAEERLQFRPGELPPPFDPTAAPRLPAADWPPERLAKAERNYAMEYIRSGLPRLAEIFGPAEAAHLGRVTGRLVGAQLYKETAALLGVEPGGAPAFADYMVRLAAGEGDVATDHARRRCRARAPPRLAADARLEPLSPSIFEAWNGLLEGALAVHDRFLRLEVLSRLDWGDDTFTWRIRRRT